MIIATISSDQLSSPGCLKLAKDFISRIRTHLQKRNIRIGRLYIKHRVVVEIEFALANPGDHAFGLFSGFEIEIRNPRVSPREVKSVAMQIENIDQQRVADIDVYSFNGKTKALRKYTRHHRQPRLITKNYERAA